MMIPDVCHQTHHAETKPDHGRPVVQSSQSNFGFNKI